MISFDIGKYSTRKVPDFHLWCHDAVFLHFKYTEDKRIYLADGMDVKRNAEIPMSAMWTPGSLAGGTDEEVRSEGDIREAASVANIYGQNIVAAESMTAIQNAFSWTPEKLKQ